MLHYSNGNVSVLNHDVHRAVAELTDYGRNLVYEDISGDFNDISRAMLEYSTSLTSPHKALLDSIGIDNAVQLALVVLQAENILIGKIGTTADSAEIVNYEPKKDSEREWNYDDAYIVASLCWKKRISIKDLAVHLNIGEGTVRIIKNSDEYLQAIGEIMLTVPNSRSAGESPTHEEIYRWIMEYPRRVMPAKFGRIMGISESAADELIEQTLEKIDYKGE